MARRPRNDTPGSWHHVMNRAIARRPIYETREDIRFFLAGVARAVRRGQLEVHAWCVMTTHFHMFVRSPAGQLSAAMHRIQNAYTRYFNRTRRRDGPLLRRRFLSKPVDTMAYRQILVSYIDANPVRADLCADPCEYPWGSACQYAKGNGPPWLHREWVEGMVAERSTSGRFDPILYPRSTDEAQRELIADLVQSRLESAETKDELDSLLAMTAPAIRHWLRRKSVLADGPPTQPPYVAAAAVTKILAKLARNHGNWIVHPSRKAVDGWSILHAGLLRDLACASLVTLAQRTGVSSVHAKRLVEHHRKLLDIDDVYGERAAHTTRRLLDTYSEQSS